jgi:hypothetical protein
VPSRIPPRIFRECGFTSGTSLSAREVSEAVRLIGEIDKLHQTGLIQATNRRPYGRTADIQPLDYFGDFQLSSLHTPQCLYLNLRRIGRRNRQDRSCSGPVQILDRPQLLLDQARCTALYVQLGSASTANNAPSPTSQVLSPASRRGHGLFPIPEKRLNRLPPIAGTGKIIRAHELCAPQ